MAPDLHGTGASERASGGFGKDEQVAALRAPAAHAGRSAPASGFGHYRTLLDDGRLNRAWADGGG